MKNSIMSCKNSFIIQGSTCIGILLIWTVLSFNFPSILIPSPYETLVALWKITITGELLQQFYLTMIRMSIGLLIGMTFATICGLLAGRFAVIYEIFRPIISFLLGIPPIILVVVAMVWFGTNSIIPVFVVSILVIPTFYINIANGCRQIDSQLLQMATVYQKSNWQKFRFIILPSLMIPFLTACSLAAGGAVRITIMAELLGTSNGVGAALTMARININTDKVFAWTFISVLTIIAIDIFILNPLKVKMMKWNMGE